MGVASVPDLRELAKLSRDQLFAIAAERGVTVPKSITKRKLLDVLDPPAASDGPLVDAMERAVEGQATEADHDAVRQGGTTNEVVALIRRFLANPSSLSDDEAREVRQWSNSTPPEEYDRVMSEASPPAVEIAKAAEKAEETLRDWKEAAGKAEMEPYRPTLLPDQSTWAHIQRIANDLSAAIALPAALRGKPADIALVLLAGRDVGVAPTAALNKIYVIDGRPSMAPELMRALILDRGHEIWFEEITPTSVTVAARRKGWPADRVSKVTWTLEMAKQANLIKGYDAKTGAVTPMERKDVWRKYTRAMLKARATSEIGRDDFPDVLLGVSYTPEELDADVDAEGAPVMVPSTATHDRDDGDGEGEVLTPEQEAVRAGWESLAAEKAAHAALRERVAALQPEQQATARQMREASGWPIRPKQKFDAIAAWVEKAERSNKAEAEPPPEGKEGRLTEAREALAQAEASFTGKPVASDTPGAEPVDAGLLGAAEEAQVVCPVCGNAAAEETQILHEEDCPNAVI